MEENMATVKQLEIPKLKCFKGYDENDNEVIIFNNCEMKSIEFAKDICQVMNSFGTTVSEFVNNIQIFATICADTLSIDLPGAETNAKTENPNQNDDLEFLNQIVFTEDFLNSKGNMFLD